MTSVITLRETGISPDCAPVTLRVCYPPYPAPMKSAELSQDPLFELERRIARRADQLSRQLGFNRCQALEHWRQAEREVLQEYTADDEVAVPADERED